MYIVLIIYVVSYEFLHLSCNFTFQIHPSVEATKVKYLLAKHFPETTSSMPDDRDDSKWLESVFENLKIQLVSNKSSRTSTNTSSIANNNNETNNNHLNNCSDVETNNLNNSSVNGDSNSSASSTAESELVLFQNAQLKTTVEEYKNIIAETVSLLLIRIKPFISIILIFRKAC